MTVSFERWLLDVGYRPATAKKTASSVATVRRYFERTGKLPKISHPTALALGKLMHFSPDDPLSRALRGVVEPCAPAPMPRRFTLERRSFGDGDWQRLAAALASSPLPEHRVLPLMVHMGLRIGETLGIDIASLDRALQSGLLFLERKGGHRVAVPLGGAVEPAQAIATHFDRRFEMLCQWIQHDKRATPLAAEGAYQRCRRALSALCAALGLDGRHNLHRIRRTVAVQALRLTHDKKAVQDLLGQSSPKSTDQYTDELREMDVAALQAQLGTFRGESSP